MTPPDWAIRTEADRLAIAAGYTWDAAAAERIVRFAESYVSQKYGTGDFRLFEWQRRFLMSLYGWRRPDGGRRFKLALLHVPKKNGKTLLVSIIAAYELFGNVQPSPLVVSASTSKDNAKQVYEQLKATITRNPKLAALTRLVEYKKALVVAEKDAEYRALSADAPTSEGLNCSAVIVDEAHAHRSPKLWRTLEYATIGRTDGITVVISTAGDDLTHWYYALVVRGRNLLAGTDTDPTTYAEVYECDPERDDLDDPATWRRANPSLDQYPGFTSEQFRLQFAAARKNAADRLAFERYRLNIFRRAEENTWIDVAVWDRQARPIADAELLKYPCWLGFDASQRIDPTSLAACWLLGAKKFHVKAWAWTAEAGVRVRESQNLPKYRQFELDGSMVITPGDVLDKAKVWAKILELRDAGHRIQTMVMDPNGAWVFGTEVAGQGIEVKRMPQNYAHFTDPTREMDVAVVEGRLTHDGSGWMRHCVQSVRLDVDAFKNCRPVKSKSADHIDGAVAVLMAFSQANQASAAIAVKPSVYETRGLLTL